VILDGKSVYACSRLAIEADGKKILTVEGLLQAGKLHPIQDAFLEHDGLQCGFCTPGQIMSVKALLDKNPRPSPEEIKEGLSGISAAVPHIQDSEIGAGRCPERIERGNFHGKELKIVGKRHAKIDGWEGQRERGLCFRRFIFRGCFTEDIAQSPSPRQGSEYRCGEG